VKIYNTIPVSRAETGMHCKKCRSPVQININIFRMIIINISFSSLPQVLPHCNRFIGFMEHVTLAFRARIFNIGRTQTYTMLKDWVNRRHALLSFIVRFCSCHAIMCYFQQQQQQHDVIMSTSNSPKINFKKRTELL